MNIYLWCKLKREAEREELRQLTRKVLGIREKRTVRDIYRESVEIPNS